MSVFALFFFPLPSCRLLSAWLNVSGGRSRSRFLSLSVSAGCCRAVCSLTQFLRSGGGTLGSKLGISVGLRLRTVGGLMSPWWASGSSLVLPYLRHLTLLSGEAVVCISVAPILVCRAGSAGSGGRGGGGCSGGLAPVGSLLPDLLGSRRCPGCPSPSYPSGP